MSFVFKGMTTRSPGLNCLSFWRDISDAYSTILSAIGVYGPSFVTVNEVITFPDMVNGVFILGMLACRLEIPPLLVFFNINAWRR